MPEYYNKAFNKVASPGPKPEERFRSGLIGQLDPMARQIGRIPAVNNMLGKMSGFASKMPGPMGSIAGSLFGSNDRPSAKDMLAYHYGRVGQLRARAESETDPRRIARLEKKMASSKGAVEKYAYKLDQKFNKKAKFLPPRTFDEIDAGRQKFVETAQAGPTQPTRTILRTL